MNKITAIALLAPMTFAHMHASSNNHDLELSNALISSDSNKALQAYDAIQKQTGDALKHEINNQPLPNFIADITFQNILNNLQTLNFILSQLNPNEAKLTLSNTINNHNYNWQIDNKKEQAQIRKLIKKIDNLLKKKK